MEAGEEGQEAFTDIVDESMPITLVRDLGGCLPTLTLSAVGWRELGSHVWGPYVDTALSFRRALLELRSDLCRQRPLFSHSECRFSIPHVRAEHEKAIRKGLTIDH